MNRIKKPTFYLAAAALCAAFPLSASAVVSVSLNVFPTDSAAADNGGDWTLVAKTDNPNGIAAINAIMRDVDNGFSPREIFLSGDIGAIDPINAGGPNERPPYLDLGGGLTDLIYGQDISDPGSVVPRVGTLATSDGPDPLGDPIWDDATIIAFGTYSGVVPGFSMSSAQTFDVDANELDTTTPPFSASDDGATQAVVRVIPEPTAVVLSIIGCTALFARRREAGGQT